MGDGKVKEVVAMQDDEDQLFLVSKGPYLGHEAILRKTGPGKIQILILALNYENEGKVKVLEVFNIEGEKPKWLIPPDAH